MRTNLKSMSSSLEINSTASFFLSEGLTYLFHFLVEQAMRALNATSHQVTLVSKQVSLFSVAQRSLSTPTNAPHSIEVNGRTYALPSSNERILAISIDGCSTEVYIHFAT